MCDVNNIYFLLFAKGQIPEEFNECEETETAAGSTRRKRQGPLIENTVIGQ